MRKPLSYMQSVVLTILWATLCFIIITSSPRIDGMLILSIVISGALVFIPIAKSFRQRNR